MIRAARVAPGLGVLVIAACAIVATAAGSAEGDAPPYKAPEHKGAAAAAMPASGLLAQIDALPGHQRGGGSPGSGGILGQLRTSIGFDMGSTNVKDVLIDGRLTWLGTSDGLIRFDNLSGEKRTYDNKSGLISNGVFHVGKLDGRIWVGTYGGGLSILDPEMQKFRHYNIPDGLGDSFVYDVMRDASGDIWIATWSGVNQVVGGALDDRAAWRLHTVASTRGGLANDWVYGLASAPDGTVWLATEGGLTRYRDGAFTSWNHAAGLGAAWDKISAEEAARGAGEGSAGGAGPSSGSSTIPNADPPAGGAAASSAAAAASDSSVPRVAADVSRHHKRQRQEQGLEGKGPAYNPNYVVALAVDPQGVVWAGTWGAGLSRFDGTSWRTFTTADGLPGNHVFALAISAGRIWVGTNRGLASFDGTGFHKLVQGVELNVSSVFTIAISEGSAWVGGFGGATWYPRGLEAVVSGNERDRK